jgi:hypothetical protein
MNLYLYWEYSEWICSCPENTRNESLPILRILGMNLFLSWEYAEWMCIYSENMRNESVCILRKRGMNLYVYGEYATQNELYLQTESQYAYALNPRNESVPMLRIRRRNLFLLRIRRVNLYVYWEYAKCTKSRISWWIRNQNLYYFKTFIAQIRSFGQTSLH